MITTLKNNFKEMLSVDQFKWVKGSYFVMLVGLIANLVTMFATGLTPLSILSTIGGILGVLTVNLITNMKRLNGLTGAISAIIIGSIGLATGQIGVAVQQLIIYMFMLDIPVMVSKKWGKDETRPTKLNGAHDILNWSAIFIVALIAGLIFTGFNFSILGLLNALIVALSFTASLGTTLKKSFTYKAWMLNGVLSILIFGIGVFTGEPFNIALALTYTTYMLNDIVGLFFSKWSHS